MQTVIEIIKRMQKDIALK